MRELNKKIILIGNINVGKTSMVARYVYHKFSEQYISTIGVRIDKKMITTDNAQINMIIWDLAGESNQQNTPQSYFLGAAAVIYVVDISSPPTFLNMEADINFVKSKIPEAIVLVAANKSDKLSETALQQHIAMMPMKPDYVTSAKENLHIETLFFELGVRLLNSIEQ